MPEKSQDPMDSQPIAQSPSQNEDFFRSALFYMEFKVCLKHFVHDFL